MLGGDFALLHAHVQPAPAGPSEDALRRQHSALKKRLEALSVGADGKYTPPKAVTEPAGRAGKASREQSIDDLFMEAVMNESATKLQRTARGHAARQQVRRQAAAAIGLQAAVRGHMARVQLHERAILRMVQSAVDQHATALGQSKGDARADDGPALRGDDATGPADSAGAASGLAATDETLEVLCEAWLPEGVRLVVFDFDHTLVRINTVREGVTPEAVASRWRSDAYDVALLRTFVTVARRRGVALGVASFGRSEVILAYMDAMLSGTGAAGAFTAANVATPAALGLPEGTTVRRHGKPKLLSILRVRAAAAAPQQPGAAARDPRRPRDRVRKTDVLFFDDRRLNIENCTSRGYTRAVHTPSGFTRRAIMAAGARRVCPQSRSHRIASRLLAALRVPVAGATDRAHARQRRRKLPAEPPSIESHAAGRFV